MTTRYEMTPERGGKWRVIDVLTGRPARWDGIPQTALELDIADDLTDLFNLLDIKRREGGEPMHRLT